jgi:hypothetical protein
MARLWSLHLSRGRAHLIERTARLKTWEVPIVLQPTLVPIPGGSHLLRACYALYSQSAPCK